PLPWTSEGPSFGFGSVEAHLPQPSWFAEHAADGQASDPASTLSLYREALRLRHQLQAEETLEWVETGRADVLRFIRPNGWQIVTNFGPEPFALPTEIVDRVVLTSGTAFDGAVPGETTVWIAPQQ
ncbi:MAG TPA: alpha-amylase, partial [Microbacterium sp.]|nr:alpha-amylase [Microbacterium sp.]